MPNETLFVPSSKPVYMSFLGNDTMMARFKQMKDGQVRVLRVDATETKFQISDRPPYDFDYAILDDPQWYPMPPGEFYRILFARLTNADLQLVIKY